MKPTKDPDDTEDIADWSNARVRVLRWDPDAFTSPDTDSGLEELVAQGKVRILSDGRKVFYVDSSPLSWPGPDDETKCPTCGATRSL